MYESVQSGFAQYVVKYEGRTTWMYQDVKGLMTTGVGNLIDPASLALDLAWLKDNGEPANPVEVLAEWGRLKSDKTLASRGAKAARAASTLHLTDQSVDELVASKLAEFWDVLVRRFPKATEWPADAQMGLVLMAWALGPHFPRTWPKFSAACEVGDWLAAAEHCVIPAARPVRNEAHQRCFTNAAAVGCGDPEVLYFPEVV